MSYNSVKFFLDSVKANLWGLDLDKWDVTSMGSGYCDDNWYWNIYLKNNKTKKEKKY